MSTESHNISAKECKRNKEWGPTILGLKSELNELILLCSRLTNNIEFIRFKGVSAWLLGAVVFCSLGH